MLFVRVQWLHSEAKGAAKAALIFDLNTYIFDVIFQAAFRFERWKSSSLFRSWFWSQNISKQSLSTHTEICHRFLYTSCCSFRNNVQKAASLWLCASEWNQYVWFVYVFTTFPSHIGVFSPLFCRFPHAYIRSYRRAVIKRDRGFCKQNDFSEETHHVDLCCCGICLGM